VVVANLQAASLRISASIIDGINMVESEIEVLRLGHRVGRDPRITTHLALVSRAMGVKKFTLAGDKDEKLFDNIDSVNERFGQGIVCRHESSPMKMLREIATSNEKHKPLIIHLTMYGEPFKETIEDIPKEQPIVVVVGGAKVPAELFTLSDYNIAVGNQPHSEVAALALFLDCWTGGKAFEQEYEGAQLIINPSKTGKDVREV